MMISSLPRLGVLLVFISACFGCSCVKEASSIDDYVRRQRNDQAKLNIESKNSYSFDNDQLVLNIIGADSITESRGSDRGLGQITVDLGLPEAIDCEITEFRQYSPARLGKSYRRIFQKHYRTTEQPAVKTIIRGQRPVTYFVSRHKSRDGSPYFLKFGFVHFYRYFVQCSHKGKMAPRLFSQFMGELAKGAKEQLPGWQSVQVKSFYETVQNKTRGFQVRYFLSNSNHSLLEVRSHRYEQEKGLNYKGLDKIITIQRERTASKLPGKKVQASFVAYVDGKEDYRLRAVQGSAALKVWGRYKKIKIASKFRGVTGDQLWFPIEASKPNNEQSKSLWPESGILTPQTFHFSQKENGAWLWQSKNVERQSWRDANFDVLKESWSEGNAVWTLRAKN